MALNALRGQGDDDSKLAQHQIQAGKEAKQSMK